MNRKTPIHSLYILKAIAAFIVVCCHFPFVLIDNYLIFISQTAVPIFFLITGYFLFHSETERLIDRVTKTLKKVLLIFILVNLFYWIWLFPKNGNILNNWNSIWQLFIFGDSLSAHLWYITALTQALLFFKVFFHYGRGKGLLLLPVLTFLTQLGVYSYLLFGIPSHFNLFLNAIASAIPYLAMGMLIHKYENKLIHLRGLWFIIIISLGMLLLEYNLFHNHGPYVFTPVLATSLVIWALRNKNFGANTFIAQIGKEYSATIYYFHIAVGTITAITLTQLHLYNLLYPSYGAVIIFFFSLGLSWVISKVQQRLGWKIF